jgi:hypothetical protein
MGYNLVYGTPGSGAKPRPETPPTPDPADKVNTTPSPDTKKDA